MPTEVLHAPGVSKGDRGNLPPGVLAAEDSPLQAPLNVQEVWMDADLGEALRLTGTPSRSTRAF